MAGEFGGMGLEGATRLGYSKELAAAKDKGGVAAEDSLFEVLTAEMYKHGRALSNVVQGELDDVIDPADSRRWILMGLESSPAPAPRTGKKRVISPW